MIPKSRRVFLDTSVIFAAVLSETGGERKLFRFGEAGVIQLVVGRNVLRECEGVVRRKVPASAAMLANLLELGLVEIATGSAVDLIEPAKALIAYQPGAIILAEAMGSDAGWFVTHGKNHYLIVDVVKSLALRIGTPGDFIQALAEQFRGV